LEEELRDFKEESQLELDRTTQKLHDNLAVVNRTIEALTVGDQDATDSIEALRVKIRKQKRIQDFANENDDLGKKLVEAEEAYDLQLKLAAGTATGRKGAIFRVKREKEAADDDGGDSVTVKRERDIDGGDGEPSERPPRRQRIVITTVEDGTVDLTGM